MPSGRRPNLDKRIADLIGQLRKALVAREQARSESTVAAQMAALVSELQGGHVATAPTPPVTAAPVAVSKRGNRKPRSAASRAAQGAKMKAYWAKRRAAQTKGGQKVGAAKG